MPVTTRLFRRLHRATLACIMLLPASHAWAETALLEHYQRLKNGDAITLPGTRISLASSEQTERLSAEVTSLLPVPFDSLAAALAQPGHWCQFMPLHFNIKACTYQQQAEGEALTVYSGRKTYEEPEDSYPMTYRFEIIQQDASQLRLRLSAEHGPLSTRDYRIELSALRVEEGTLLHIHSAYRPSRLSAMLTRTYLATLGRDKVGFSHIEQAGEVQPVQGVRGIIERNVMRYQLAIESFLDTQTQAETGRHEARLLSWFRHNDRYPQLHEMNEAEYLEIKREEWRNQQQLQQTLNRKLHLAAMP